MIIRIAIMIAMAAAMVWCANNIDPALGLPAAIGIWAGIAGAACGFGAGCLTLQPLATPTLFGAVGGSIVRWGYRVGGGRLIGAVAVSWLIWVLAGGAVIAGIRLRSEIQSVLMILAWTVDLGILMYIIGVMLRNYGGGRVPMSLIKIAIAVIAMIVSSGVLWFHIATESARHTALLIAGGPPAFIGAGYGVFILFVLAMGKNARWN